MHSVFQVNLILDANVVIDELSRFATRRIKPDVASALLEVLDWYRCSARIYAV